jgi:hypothetical protein
MKSPHHPLPLNAPSPPRRDRLSRRVLAGALLGAALYLTVSWLDVGRFAKGLLCRQHGLEDLNNGNSLVESSNKVPLEAHIMSKCPDARDCLQQLVVPAMEQVNDKVDFDLSFIAR